MDFAPALPVFLITLREGLEATLVIGIVLAYLAKLGAKRLFPSVYFGIGTGIAVSIFLGFLITYSLDRVGLSRWEYGVVAKYFLEAGVAVIAIGLLTWMLLWMTQTAKGLKTEIETSVGVAVATGTGIFSLVFVDVLREGVETALFIGAQAQRDGVTLVGAIAGVVGAGLLGWLIFQGGVKLNLKLFFRLMGVVLLLIVGGLVITALRKVELGMESWSQLAPAVRSWCAGKSSCLLGEQVWDLSAILPDRQFPGLLLKTLLGYRDKLYLGQAIGYLTFLLPVGWLYWRKLEGK
ncbi:MAG: FTR1 family protein [Pseudanabaenaceae cyanobacterium SKYGB_i_bin29]|nr:FTR1 family iron permease [Pseudanabaenaceae cyanobacterium SKYG29]MDW8422101.1 FTR1 family protein [Pseudanabaenaceae cyanobacterium SKYGB_i_bin29]